MKGFNGSSKAGKRASLNWPIGEVFFWMRSLSFPGGAGRSSEVLQEKEIERVGGTEIITVDDGSYQPHVTLRTLVSQGQFRKDLFFVDVFFRSDTPFAYRLEV
jgi:hypothetical protein